MKDATAEADSPQAQEAEVHFAVVAGNMRSGVAAGMAAVPLFVSALSVRGPLDWPVALTWAAVLFLLLSSYYFMAPLRLRWQARGELQRWWRLLLVYNAVVGVTWGLSGLLFFDADPVRLLVLVMLQMGMMLSVATGSAPLMSATYLNLLPCTLPMVARGLLDPEPLARFAAAAVLLMLAFMLAYAHGYSRMVRDSVRMRFENQRLNEALTEQRVRERTAVLEAASAHKSAFLATVSHEIRTPMNAIIGMSGLLLDSAQSPEQRDYTTTIRDSAETLLTIINDILDISKIEAGRMGVEQQPFALRACIESALDLVELRAAQKGLELAVDVDAELPPTVMGDVTRLRQVLLNLLANSVKFTDSGEVVLTVRQQQGQLKFSVRDTGIGLTEEGLSRLFENFSQADSSTTRKYGGTGLGLAISKRLVELMGGRMWAQSEGPGRGSCFHFTLPAVVGEMAPQARRELVGPQPDLTGRRMLVVDDNPTNRRILALQAGKWGMVVSDTDSPLQALQLALTEPFDLAVLDMHMPHMDGATLARRLRDLRPDLPRVLFTSLGRREAEEDLFSAVMMKPLRQSQLFDTLVTVLRGAPAVMPDASPAARTLDPGMAHRHPLRILLAEDNPVNQTVALHMLGQLGYTADIAADGAQAVACAERQPYDLVLMDMQMPETDGLTATRLLVERLGAARPRIVAMTANAMQGDREQCLAAGMDDYITKPIRSEALRAVLELTPQRREAA